MKVHVNGVDLFFDVEGPVLAVDGGAMRDRPTLVLLHGGPGFDHTIYRPRFSELADTAQLVYLDLRGNGRSDWGPKEDWNLAQWGDDIRTFCDVLGIQDPVVYGSSWGGTVALSYASRHPEHPSKLILVSTEAKAYTHLDKRIELFTRLGGQEIGDLAKRRFIEGDTSPELLEAWLRDAFPFYTHATLNPDVVQRASRNPEVTAWFTRSDGEGRNFDMLADLPALTCPTLVIGGEDDPMVPIECQIDLVQALQPAIGRLERIRGAGHGVVADAPETAFRLIRDFIREPERHHDSARA